MKSVNSVNNEMIYTDKAPDPIGPYSQAVKSGNFVFLSGQIPKDAQTGKMITGNFIQEAEQVFYNLSQVAQGAGGSLQDIIKLTVFLMDLNDFQTVNTIMTNLFKPPYPARSTIQVAKLPAGARIEIEAIMLTD